MPARALRWLALLLAGAAAASAQEPAARAWPDPYPDRVERKGAEPGVTARIDAALDWLVRHQEPDGHWSALAWDQRCQADGCVSPKQPEHGLAAFDVGVTGLATLALLGGGHAPGRGAHGPAVERALAWLVAQQAADGSLGLVSADDALPASVQHGVQVPAPIPIAPPRIPGQPPRPLPERGPPQFSGGAPPLAWTIYNHALATLALCEALAITADDPRREPAARAVDWCVQAQNPGLGWKYGLRPGRNDTSVTAWMTQVLRAAADARIEVPPAALEGALHWFQRVRDSEGLAGYETPGGEASALQVGGTPFFGDSSGTAAMATWAALLAGDKRSDAAQKKVRAMVLGAVPTLEGGLLSFTYLYYGANLVAAGARDSKAIKWEKALASLLAPQRAGCARGAWEPLEVWCVAGGRVYATAMGALALEARWRFPRGK